MEFQLAALPYAAADLEPHISARTVDFHYNKHHAGYVSKLAAAIEGTSEADSSLEELVRSSSGGVFNNAAQVWNHTFYWQSLAPAGGEGPGDFMRDLLQQHFGGVEAFKRELGEIATGQFGSGWAWLVMDEHGKLRNVSTHDADNPLLSNQIPILTIDVWEHAYYLDYQNARDKYVEACMDHLLNWQFAESNVKAAMA